MSEPPGFRTVTDSLPRPATKFIGALIVIRLFPSTV